jgi:hypothetical protein
MSEQGPVPASALGTNASVSVPDRADFVRVDLASSQLVAWLLLALLNQVIATVQLPAVSARVNALHRLYDFGQLLALGALSWSIVWARNTLVRRLPAAAQWLGLPAFAALALVVGLFTLPDDILNLAERRSTPPWQMTALFSLAFACTLVVAAYLRRVVRGWRRGLAGAAGLALFTFNALVLPGDYFGSHLLIAWLAALLLAAAVEGLSVPGAALPKSSIGGVVVGMWSVISLLIPANDRVRLRLYQLPSSCVQPLLAVLLPEGAGAIAERVPPRYRHSEWFQPRARLAPVAPSRAIVPIAPPIVMFFTIDAMRADVLETPKYREQLPVLAGLRDSGVYFTHARSPTASTMTTLASALAGKYYSQLRWGGSGLGATLLSEPGSRLAELLDAAGVGTLFVSGLPKRIQNDARAAQGFRQHVELPRSQAGAGLAVDAIIRELERRRGGPLFVYGHFMEPHAPYNLAGRHGTQFERYVREIGLVDRELGRLRGYLKSAGLADHSYLFVSADHGEAFGEHGVVNHARTMYEELLRVPLLVEAPGGVARHVSEPVTLIDVGPTVLDLFGLPTPEFWMGESLSPLLAGKAISLGRPIAFDGARRIQGLCFPEGYKVILDASRKTVEVYDLKRDPAELNNLVDEPDMIGFIEASRLFFDVVTHRAPGYTIPKRKF